jgi:hypothetical protein
MIEWAALKRISRDRDQVDNLIKAFEKKTNEAVSVGKFSEEEAAYFNTLVKIATA